MSFSFKATKPKHICVFYVIQTRSHWNWRRNSILCDENERIVVLCTFNGGNIDDCCSLRHSYKINKVTKFIAFHIPTIKKLILVISRFCTLFVITIVRPYRQDIRVFWILNTVSSYRSNKFSLEMHSTRYILSLTHDKSLSVTPSRPTAIL